LEEFFGDTRVNRIAEKDIRDYIASRQSAGIANATINKELGLLIGVLSRAKRWYPVAGEIKRLPVRANRVGPALEPGEKAWLLRVSGLNELWLRARAAIVLALNTTMRTSELRNLQWRDIDWLERMVRIRRGKTPESERNIPLNRQAYDVMVALREDAKF